MYYQTIGIPPEQASAFHHRDREFNSHCGHMIFIIYVKRVSQRSAESCWFSQWFSPSTLISSNNEGLRLAPIVVLAPK